MVIHETKNFNKKCELISPFLFPLHQQFSSFLNYIATSNAAAQLAPKFSADVWLFTNVIGILLFSPCGGLWGKG